MEYTVTRIPKCAHANIQVTAGLDALGALLQKWKTDPKEYSPEDMKACLDSWREVLFRHLDEEVSRRSDP